jgi:hypothetical protein
MRWLGHVESKGRGKMHIRVLWEIKPIRTPRRMRENNIKVELKERGINGKDCIDLAKDQSQFNTFTWCRDQDIGE